MNTLVLSLIRTYVPILIGGLVAWLLTIGVDLDAEAQAGLIVALTGVLQAVYYTAVRLLEQRFPGVGVLLGSAKTPDSYSNDQTIPGEVVEESVLPEYPTGDADELVDDGVLGRREAAGPSA